jgi:hypothetical protein
VAIRHVWVYVRRFKELSDDPRLAEAERDFLRLAPHAKDLRDFLEHLDEYAVGAGRMHTSGALDRTDRTVQLLMPEGGGQPDDEITVVLGERFVPVKTAAHAAMALADALAKIHREELDTTMRVLEETYGRPPLLLLGDEPPAARPSPKAPCQDATGRQHPWRVIRKRANRIGARLVRAWRRAFGPSTTKPPR